MSEIKKPGRGGKRPNQTGRPKGPETDSITFRAEKAKLDEARKLYGKSLNQMFAAWLDDQVKK